MALISVGKSDLKFSASAHEGRTVVIRGDDSFYPLVGIHLNLDEARDLAAQINAAIAIIGDE